MESTTDDILKRLEQRLTPFEISPVLFDDQWHGRGNILISDPTPISWDDGLWKFQCLQKVGGLPAACNLNAPCDTYIQQWRDGMKILVFTKEPMHQLFQSGSFALLYDVERVFEDPIYIARMDGNSAIKVWDLKTSFQNDLRLMDIFCGGFGGWSFGAKAVSQIGMPIQTVACLDCDQFAVANHQANHSGSVFRNSDFVVDSPRDLPVHIISKADPKTVLQIAQKTRANAFAMSFPCQPWSRSGGARGFEDDNGLVAADALGYIRLARPPVVFLENVSSISEHSHFRLFLKCIQWSGYRVCWRQCIELSKFTPASRNRWVAILIDEYRPHLMFDTQNIAFPTLGRMTLGSFEVLLNSIPTQIQRQLDLDDRMLSIYGDPAFAQSFASVVPWSSQQHVLSARTLGRHSKASTFMAQYGNQHELPHDMLRQQGIHTQFVKDELSGDLRFFAPHEIAMCMPVLNQLILPVKCKLAWKFVGNCISPLHAAIVFNVAFNGMFGCDFDVGRTIRFFLMNRLTDENSHLNIHGDRAVLTKSVTSISDDHEEVDNFDSTQVFKSRIGITIHTQEAVHHVSTNGDLDMLAILSLHAIDRKAKVIYKFEDGKPVPCQNEIITMHDTVIHVIDFHENFDDDDYRAVVRIRMMLHPQRFIGQYKEPILLQIKWKGKPVYNVKFDPEFPCDKLRDIVELSYIRGDRETPFVLSIGPCRLQCGAALGLFANNGIVKLQCQYQLCGGGPKQESIDFALRGIENLLVEKGCPAASASQRAQQTLQCLGAHAIISSISEKSNVKKWKALQNEATKRNFTLLSRDEIVNFSAVKIQNIVKRNNAKKQALPFAEGLIVEQGWFKNADGSDAPIIPKIGPRLTGVAIADYDSVKHVLDGNTKFSPDELAVIIPWKQGWNIPTGDLMHVPVKDKQGSPAVIHALFVQLGDKAVTFGNGAIRGVDVDFFTNVTAFIERDELSRDDWNELTSHPVRFALARFPNDLVKKSVMRVWGRTYFDGKKRCESEGATIFQFQLAIRDSDLNEMLARSGINGVYLRPKHDTARTDPRFAVIWTPSKFEAEKALARLTSHKGLVKNAKGYGIRMLVADAKAAHDIVRPGVPFVTHLPILHTYKLSPLPKGTSEKAITEISERIKWTFKPIKRLGDSAWLVGSSTKATHQFIDVDGMPVLVQETATSSNEPKSSVIAGSVNASRQVSARTESSNEDPWKHYDPWMQQTGNRAPSVAAGAASITGPTQAILDEYNNRIEKMEKSMTDMQSDSKMFVEKVDRQFQEASHNMQRIEKQFQHDMTALSKHFADTLHESMRGQEKTMMSQFEDIKSLFRKQDKRKTPATPEKEDENL